MKVPTLKPVALGLLLAAAAFGQAPNPAPAAAAKPIPRMPDGKPDFTGAWQGGGVSLYGESRGQHAGYGCHSASGSRRRWRRTGRGRRTR